MRDSRRLGYIEVIRVIAMLMIVALHSICYYTGKWGEYVERPRIELYDGVSDILHGIALPMFTCISGFLYALQRECGKYADYGRFVVGKVKRLVVPMVVWSAFCMLIIPGAEFSITGLLGYHHLWFLGMLFWLFAVSPVLLRMARIGEMGVLVCAGALVVVSYLFSKNPMARLPFELADAGKYMCAFFAGIAAGVHRKKFAEMSGARLWIVGAVLMLAFACESMLWRRIDSYIIAILCHFSRYLVSTVLCVVVIAIFMKAGVRAGKRVAYLSALSMGIYEIHHIVIELLLKLDHVDEFMRENVMLAPMMLMAVVMLVSTGLADVMKRNKILSKII